MHYFKIRDEVELISTERQAKKVILDALGSYLDCSTPLQFEKLPCITTEFTVDDFVDTIDAIVSVTISAIRVDLGIADADDEEYLKETKSLTSKLKARQER